MFRQIIPQAAPGLKTARAALIVRDRSDENPQFLEIACQASPGKPRCSPPRPALRYQQGESTLQGSSGLNICSLPV